MRSVDLSSKLQKVCACKKMNVGVLPDVIDSGSEIVGAMCECTVGSVFDAKSPIVCVMDTHARFVVFQVIPAFRVTCRSMKIRAPAIHKKWH